MESQLYRAHHFDAMTLPQPSSSWIGAYSSVSNLTTLRRAEGAWMEWIQHPETCWRTDGLAFGRLVRVRAPCVRLRTVVSAATRRLLCRSAQPVCFEGATRRQETCTR